MQPLHDHLQAIATIASLINPMVCTMMFSSIAKGQDRPAAIRSATLAVLIVAVVLIVAAVFGASILKTFGISLDAFSVAGGAVLMVIGFSMLQGPGPQQAQAPASEGLSRLILFAASPGTITGVITIAASQSRDALPVATIVAVAVVLAVTWLLLVLTSARGKSEPRPSLAHNMISRYMGLIIVAMGIQFALKGFKAFMAG